MGNAIRTIQPDDLFRLEFVHDAQLSPDGTRVAFVVSRVDAEKQEEYLSIRLLSLETGEARPLTAGLCRDSDPRWSPDGRQIAFLSTRTGTPQLYSIPTDGGEAHALTALAQGAGGGPVWSPDGRLIAFAAAPDGPQPDPTRPYRVTRHLYRFDGAGTGLVNEIYVVPSAGGPATQLTHANGTAYAPVWSPDGNEILFLVTDLDSHRVLPSMHLVSLEGESRALLPRWGSAEAACWTPDGQRIAFYGESFEQPPTGARARLWVVSRDGGQPECRTPSIRFEVGGSLQPDMPVMRAGSALLATRDGRSAVVQVQRGGEVSIFRVGLAGPESWEPVVSGERACTLLDMDDRHLLFAVHTLQSPPELYLCDLDGSSERQLTRINAELLAQRRLPTVEHMLFRSSDGAQVEGWILKPPIGEPPYPTILYSHGGPRWAFGNTFSFDFQMLAGAGYAVLFVNYRGSSGYEDAFGIRPFGQAADLYFDDSMAGVDDVIKRGIADPDRLGCCGLSAGGLMTCWIVGHTDRFQAAVAENPVTNWASMYGVSDIGPWFAGAHMGGAPHEVPETYARSSPITYAHRCKTPTLMVQGECDYRCPTEQSEQFYAVLKANGCVVEMLRLPGSSHCGSAQGPVPARQAQNEALLEWMNRHIGNPDGAKDLSRPSSGRSVVEGPGAAEPTDPADGEAKTVDVDDITIYYRELGQGEPLLLLHGGLGSHESWRHQIHEFARHFRVLAPDTRGHGRSTDSDRPYSYGLYASDWVGFLHELGIDRAHIVGHSDGACTGLALGMQHPEVIRKLVLIGTPYNMSNYPEGTLDLFARMTAAEYLATSGPESRKRIQESIRLFEAMGKSWDVFFSKLVNDMYLREPTYTLAQVSRIPVPTLVVHSANDSFCSPRHAEDMARAIPGARLVIIPDASHMAPQENPEIVNKVVLDFLRG